MSIPLKVAQITARDLCESITTFCERMLVCGSIRRQKKDVKDIDLVVIPKPRGTVDIVLWAREQAVFGTRFIKAGKAEIHLSFRGTPVDIYLATEETWHTLVLIRTGSKEHNVKMCAEAKSRGWKMKTAGEGLFDEKGKRIAGDSEESFFEAFGWPYKEPEDR